MPKGNGLDQGRRPLAVTAKLPHHTQSPQFQETVGAYHESGPEGVGQAGGGNSENVAEFFGVDRAVHMHAQILVGCDDDTSPGPGIAWQPDFRRALRRDQITRRPEQGFTQGEAWLLGDKEVWNGDGRLSRAARTMRSQRAQRPAPPEAAHSIPDKEASIAVVAPESLHRSEGRGSGRREDCWAAGWHAATPAAGVDADDAGLAGDAVEQKCLDVFER